MWLIDRYYTLLNEMNRISDLPQLALYFGFIILRPDRKVLSCILQELISSMMKNEVFLPRVAFLTNISKAACLLSPRVDRFKISRPVEKEKNELAVVRIILMALFWQIILSCNEKYSITGKNNTPRSRLEEITNFHIKRDRIKLS